MSAVAAAVRYEPCAGRRPFTSPTVCLALAWNRRRPAGLNGSLVHCSTACLHCPPGTPEALLGHLPALTIGKRLQVRAIQVGTHDGALLDAARSGAALHNVERGACGRGVMDRH